MWGTSHTGPAVPAPRDGAPSGTARAADRGRCGALQDWQQVNQTHLRPRSSGVQGGLDLGPSHQHLPMAGYPKGSQCKQRPLNPPLSHQVPSSPRLHFPRATQLCPWVSLSHAHTHPVTQCSHSAVRPCRKPAACGQGALVLRKDFLGRALPAQPAALRHTLGALIRSRKNKAPSAGRECRASSCPDISASASSRAPSDSSETEASFTSASSLPSLSMPQPSSRASFREGDFRVDTRCWASGPSSFLFLARGQLCKLEEGGQAVATHNASLPFTLFLSASYHHPSARNPRFADGVTWSPQDDLSHPSVPRVCPKLSYMSPAASQQPKWETQCFASAGTAPS